MKTQELLNAFQHVDDQYLELAEKSQAKPFHRKISRRILPIAAAAALMFALSATAYAANLFGAADLFKDLFGEVSSSQAEIMEEISAPELPAAVTANGTTVTPLALLSDGEYYYARLRIEAPEGTVLNIPDESTGFLQIFGSEPESMSMLHDETGKQTGYAPKAQWIDETENDNALDLYLYIERSSAAAGRNIFTFRGLWIQGIDKEYTQILEGPWSIDLGDAAEAEHRELAVDGMTFKRVHNGEVFDWEEGESMVLRSMSISSLALKFSYDFTNDDPNTIPGPGAIQLVMREGEVIDVDQMVGSTWDESHGSWQYLFDSPIVINEIDHIRFGDLQIPMN